MTLRSSFLFFLMPVNNRNRLTNQSIFGAGLPEPHAGSFREFPLARTGQGLYPVCNFNMRVQNFVLIYRCVFYKGSKVLNKSLGKASMKVKIFQTLVIALILLPQANSWAADWQLAATVDTGRFYYDKSNVIEISKGTLSVWVRFELSPEGIQDWVGKFGDRFKDLDHITTVEEYDCAKQKRRVVYANFSSKKGMILSDNEKTGWEAIIAETPTYSLWRAICRRPM